MQNVSHSVMYSTDMLHPSPVRMGIVGLIFVCIGVLLGVGVLGISNQCSEGNLSTRTVKADGLGRSYQLYVPALRPTKKPAPLVLVLHGGGGPLGDAMSMFLYSGWKEIAEKECVVIAFAEGTPEDISLSIQVNPVLPDYNPLVWRIIPTDARTHDISYIANIIADVDSLIDTDPARVFVTGFSNGGTFSYFVGSALSHIVGAVASVEGAYSPLPEQLEYPVSLLRVSGIPASVRPGPNSHAPSDVWSELLECTHYIDTHTGDTWIRTYPECKGGAEIVEILVSGMGHVYPGATQGLFGEGVYTGTFSAPKETWQFFEHNPKPGL